MSCGALSRRSPDFIFICVVVNEIRREGGIGKG